MKNTFIIFLFLSVAFFGALPYVQAQQAAPWVTYHIKSLTEADGFYISTINNTGNRRAEACVNNAFLAPLSTAFQWAFEPVEEEEGWFRLVQKPSNLALDVQRGNPNPGTRLWLFRKNESDAQKFRIERIGEAFYIIPKINERLRLAIQGNTRQGARLIIASPSDDDSQKWTFEASGVERKYALILESIQCIRESDPGKGVEVFGKIEGTLKTRRSGSEVWKDLMYDVPSSRRVSIREGNHHQLQLVQYFEAYNSRLAQGQLYIQLNIRLKEHDNLTRNDSFNFQDTWDLSKGLGPLVTRRMVVDGTILELNWRLCLYEKGHLRGRS